MKQKECTGRLMNKEEYICWLMNIIIHHKKLYYSGKSIMTDRNYDKYEDTLRQLDPTNPVLDLVGYSEDYEKYVTLGNWYSDSIPNK